jgi:MFS family permease
MIVEGLSATLTGPIWGKWADRSSRAVLRGAMSSVSLLLLVVVVFAIWVDGDLVNRIFFPVILFLIGASHAGVRVGRKTYIVDMAEGNKRTDYVSVGNTLIGVILIIAGVLTGLASLISIPVALGIFAVLAALGALYGHRLPSVSEA